MTYRQPKECCRCGHVLPHDVQECRHCRTDRFLQGVDAR